MYYEYFGLNQPPFRITPDTNLFFPGANRGAILEALIYAVGNGEGIVKVVGEVGSGKTMLCRMLEQELPERVEVVYIANPSLAPENILHVIAFELKLQVSPSTPRLEVMHVLQEFLLTRHAENRQVVVFVEEAQGMPIATLEEIRLLSNLETSQNKLLQIVLFGQPELDEKLALDEIRQLKERITYSFQLAPFNPNDIRDYLNSRVRACGYRAAELFSPGAVQAIANYSHGLVRRINIVADKSLLAAYADSSIQVSKVHVVKAARDSEFTSARRRWWLPALVAGGALVLFGALAVFWWHGRTVPDKAVAEAPAPGITAPVSTRESRPQPPVFQMEESVSAAPKVEPGPALPEAQPPAEPPPQEPVLEAEGTQSEMSAPAEAAAVLTEPPAAAPADDSAHPTESSPLFELQEEADSTLSAAELTSMRQQVSAQPPEEAPAATPDVVDPPCKLCWGIVYRPLAEPESL
jgi:type II secretory pathway predicted ATPase ExeA